MRPRYFFLLLAVIFSADLFAQQSNEAAGHSMENRVTENMRDSLLLDELQTVSIFKINMQILEAKKLARKGGKAPEELRLSMQRAENTRDSLYAGVLTQKQFALYLVKKRGIVTNGKPGR